MLIGCGLPYDRLNNGKGNKVPKKSFIFKNKNKFDTERFSQEIDLDYFYELEKIYESDRNFSPNGVYYDENPTKGVCQFYENGCVRFMNKKLMNPSPDMNGIRGIIYFKGNQMYADVFQGRSNNIMHIVTNKIKIENDKFYMLDVSNLSGRLCFVYKKAFKIPTEYKKFKAEW